MISTDLYPVILQDLCICCDDCIEACPLDAIRKPQDSACAKCIKYCISMEVPCRPDLPVICLENCDACGICAEACEHEAISMQLQKE